MQTRARLAIAALLLCLLVMAGCVRQSPVLLQETVSAPPEQSAPVEAEQEVVLEDAVDALGEAVLDSETHYQRYISFSDMRVYEYDNAALLDGICTSTYPETLYGTYEMIYRGADGVVIAHGTLIIGDVAGEIPGGRSVVRAEIDTDIDVANLTYTLQVQETLHPAAD
ncbi:hypothetical protein LJC07_01920 [Christensenellaceae bacterium OttesenSCG-928-L17]|nr:hypothetical protein [Christensenellaceae bacterium OttesenSCG-928-L17]